MLNRLRQLQRLSVIYRTLVNNGLDEIIRATPLFPLLRFFLFLTPQYWLRKEDRSRGERIRMTLEELGPIFVKFGQILSTRRDLLPDDIAVELTRLQDNVPPFPGGEARNIVENAYGQPLACVFAEFDMVPFAAASIAQVHAARLHNGREVVVKIVRPGIAARIRNDLGVMYMLAALANRYWTDGRRLRPQEVVAEFEKTLYDELDLLREAGNCTLVRRNFEDSDLLYIPEVEWEYSRVNIMVMERISGIPVGDTEELKRRGINFKYLAEIGVEIFFTQVFRDNFFHADMHPGNIFIDAANPEYPHYIAIDFGIMGSLSNEDQHYLAENFIAFFRRDYRRVAELHVHSEWVPAGTRAEEFEGAIRSVCEPIFNRPIKEISFGLLLLHLFQTARRFNMEIQPQLVLLQKTLLNIEGLGRQLYPDLDLWQTAKPFLERWMKERVGMPALIREFRDNAPLWLEKLPKLPILFHDTLEQVQAAQAQNERAGEELQALRIETQKSNQRTIMAITGGAMVISSSLILALDTLSAFNMPLLGAFLGSAGFVILAAAWMK